MVQLGGRGHETGGVQPAHGLYDTVCVRRINNG
jgi:hypothetical protein